MQEFKPLVSIIIPVYNGSDYVEEAINSALNQTYKNIEIIVINDGSEDDGKTEKIILGYGDRVRYYKKENGGVSTALNYGIRHMKGEYFSWLSHDDMYLPNKIEASVDALAKCENKSTIISCSTMQIDKYSNPIKRKKNKKNNNYVLLQSDEMLLRLLRVGTVNGCSLLIHKEIFEKCGLFDERLRFNQDGFMWMKIFLKDFPILFIPQVGVQGRVHEKQLTVTGQDIFHKDCLMMSEFLIPELIKKSVNDKKYLCEYVRYNAKYSNHEVVKEVNKQAKKLKMFNYGDEIINGLYGLYGEIRPMIKKLYYFFKY